MAILSLPSNTGYHVSSRRHCVSDRCHCLTGEGRGGARRGGAGRVELADSHPDTALMSCLRPDRLAVGVTAITPPLLSAPPLPRSVLLLSALCPQSDLLTSPSNLSHRHHRLTRPWLPCPSLRLTSVVSILMLFSAKMKTDLNRYQKLKELKGPNQHFPE